MIAGLVTAIGSAWLYHDLARYRANKQAIGSLTARRVKVWAKPGGSAWFWRPFGYHSTNIVEAIKFNGFDTQIRGVTDQDLQALRELHGLTRVDLNNTVISDATLGHLFDKVHLKTVSIAGTRITDSGLAYLTRLAGLRELDLSHNVGITDDGLAHLKGLSNLTRLGLLGTRVTEAGVRELQKALPHCSIVTIDWIEARDTRADPERRTGPCIIAGCRAPR